MRDAGYSSKTAKTPKKLLTGKNFIELLDEVGISDKFIAEKHLELMNSTRLDHMIFPLGPGEAVEVDSDEDGDEGGLLIQGGGEHTALTDDQIREMLKSVNCVVRKIIHGQQARHVYFWSADNRARKDAIDMALKIKGHYAPEKKQISGGLNLSALFDGANDEPLEDEE